MLGPHSRIKDRYYESGVVIPTGPLPDGHPNAGEISPYAGEVNNYTGQTYGEFYADCETSDGWKTKLVDATPAEAAARHCEGADRHYVGTTQSKTDPKTVQCLESGKIEVTSWMTRRSNSDREARNAAQAAWLRDYREIGARNRQAKENAGVVTVFDETAYRAAVAAWRKAEGMHMEYRNALGEYDTIKNNYRNSMFVDCSLAGCRLVNPER